MITLSRTALPGPLFRPPRAPPRPPRPPRTSVWPPG